MQSEPLERAWREERARIVGSLARRFGDLELAEDAMQEAFVAAHKKWPVDGEPQRPGAWLHTVAYRKAIGMTRKRQPNVELGAVGVDLVDAVESDRRSSTDDDLLGLLLACCHPALSSEASVALTLRHVCGLTVEEISAGFVVPTATMAKRLVRARAKIKAARIPFTVPDAAAIGERINEIHTVVYLVFTEGHLATGDGHAIRTDLCDEAIWLARQIVELHPAIDESRGLLALLLLQHARRSARLDDDGNLSPLDEQDRDRWDHHAINEARTLLADPNVTTLGPYRVEAAIAALHVDADEPDWARIADLYGILARLAPSPVVEINRAIAVGHADGPHAGLAVLEPVLASGRLDDYPYTHAAHAQLLATSGDDHAANAAWQRAAQLSTNSTQRAAIEERQRSSRTIATE